MKTDVKQIQFWRFMRNNKEQKNYTRKNNRFNNVTWKSAQMPASRAVKKNVNLTVLLTMKTGSFPRLIFRLFLDSIVFFLNLKLTVCVYICIYVYIYKNSASHIKQILQAIPQEKTAEWLLSSYLLNYRNKTNRKCSTLLGKQGGNQKWHSPMDPFTWTLADQ